MCDDEKPTVVIDNGSGMCKAGFAGEDEPTSVFSSIVGRPRRDAVAGLQDSYVGDEAQAKRDLLSLKYPIDFGMITNWDDMEKIWHHTFDNRLRVASEEHFVLLTEAPLGPKAQKEKIAEVMFEQFNVPALYLAVPGLLSFFGSAPGSPLTGLVVESGDTLSTIVPVVEGNIIQAAIERIELGGRDLTYYLMKLMSKRSDVSFTTSSLREVVREVKEELCYVALDFDDELSKVSSSNSLEKPYKQLATLGSERFCCPEALFRPSLLDERNSEEQSLPEMIHSVVMQFDEDLRKMFYKNIYLCGGNTMFPGFADRMQKEIVASSVSSTIQVTTHARPDRRISAWVGGSLLGSLSSFKDICVLKQDYEEGGPNAVHKKF